MREKMTKVKDVGNEDVSVENKKNLENDYICSFCKEEGN